MLSEYPDVLTTDEAREILRIGYNALNKLLLEQRLKAFRNGRVWLIPKQAIIEYIRFQSNLK